jgi:hypothetical protein
VRRPGGQETAAILLTAIGLRTGDLAPLAAASRPDTERLPAWARLAAATRHEGTGGTTIARAAADVAADAAAAGEQTGPAAVAGLRKLASTAVGTLDDLLRCVRHDVLDWTWSGGPGIAVQSETATRASGVVCDAVAGAYAGHLLSTEDRTVLGEPWRRVWAARTPPVTDLGPGAPEVRALLTRLRDIDGAGRGVVRRAAEAHRGKDTGARGWALAVHNASWAAHLSGRTRAAAAAQMQAVAAVQRGGFSAQDCAAGVWNLVSGAVHAMIVADLLADVDHLALTEPLETLG